MSVEQVQAKKCKVAWAPLWVRKRLLGQAGLLWGWFDPLNVWALRINTPVGLATQNHISDTSKCLAIHLLRCASTGSTRLGLHCDQAWLSSYTAAFLHWCYCDSKLDAGSRCDPCLKIVIMLLAFKPISSPWHLDQSEWKAFTYFS